MNSIARLARLRGFIVDLDGTTYLGDEVIAGAREFLTFLAGSGRKHLFVTNNSSTTGAAYVDKLRRLGLPATDGAVLTSGEATAMFLTRKGYRRLYVVGTPDLEAEMKAAGCELVDTQPDCVVLGFDKTLTYAKLEAATRFITAGAKFVATHPDVVCPTPTGSIPDCGSMIALLQAATGVSPVIVGKPEPLMVEMALAKLDLEAEQVAVIGDRLYTDIAMARRTRTMGVLVLSGESSRTMADAAADAPDLVVEHVGELMAMLRSADAVGAGRASGRETA